jgi:outer membrane protein assembly factor BamB
MIDMIGQPSRRKEILSGLGLPALRILEAPHGAIVSVIKAGGDDVRLVAIDSETGISRWRSKKFRIENFCWFLSIGDVILVRGMQDGKSDSTNSKRALWAFDVRNGRQLWRNDQIEERWLELVSLPEPRLLVLLASRKLYSASPSLYVLDLDTGVANWKVPVSSRCLPLLSYQGSSKDFSNRYRWKATSVFYQDPVNFFSYLQEGKGIILAAPQHPRTGLPLTRRLRRYDLATGELLWTYEGVVSSIWVAEDRIFVLTSTNLVVLERQSGRLLAEWYPHEEKKIKWFRAPEAQFLRLDGDLLFIHYPAGKDYQLKALDTKTGAERWEVKPSKEPLRQFDLVDDLIPVASGQNLLLLDKHTGKTTATIPMPFERPVSGAYLTPDQGIVLQSDNRIAKYDTKTWNEVYDTGEIPLPKASKGSALGQLFGTIFAVALADAMIDMSQPPKGQPPTYLTHQAMGASVNMLAGIWRPSHDQTTRIHEMGGDYAFYITNRGADNPMLRIDTRNGKMSLGAPYRTADGLVTVLDDFRGVSVEFRKKKVLGYRYAIDEDARRAHRYLDSFSSGSECLKRAEGLGRAGLDQQAATELREAARAFDNAAQAAIEPIDEVTARMRLATVYLSLAETEPQDGDQHREKASATLNSIISLVRGTTDENMNAAAEAATAMLAHLGSPRQK